MNDDQRSKARFASALRVVKHAMHEYDVLGDVVKIRYVPPTKQVDKDDHPTRYCAHNVPFHQPCKSCGRDEQDCVVYLNAAIMRVKELLAQITPKKVKP